METHLVYFQGLPGNLGGNILTPLTIKVPIVLNFSQERKLFPFVFKIYASKNAYTHSCLHTLIQSFCISFRIFLFNMNTFMKRLHLSHVTNGFTSLHLLCSVIIIIYIHSLLIQAKILLIIFYWQLPIFLRHIFVHDDFQCHEPFLLLFAFNHTVKIQR